MTASDWREAIDEFDSIDDAAAGDGVAPPWPARTG